MINYSPKVGEVLECDFGKFQYIGDTNQLDMDNYDGRIPPEIVKKRMVVVLNGKLDNGCLVVPISSTKNLNGINRGLHIPLDPGMFKITNFYDSRDRWAKTDLIQMVSRHRLYKMMDNGTRFDQHIPHDTVTTIQLAVIKAISASSLIPKPQKGESPT
ncbi:type II toxin-antitoxin system PemK/MazF family toxin [Shewanella sp. A32]|uniref:type II toxin-antitoxin system PemK/MazF family toxin n=1 Tax=Shewanella sp. A32 TaxID=3031327 RepID=UPI0023B8F10D|nr:type II toxin-antitoxin system PemK/MazF family toxin [Shewanella sp. A32]MDF0536035.1 type II toxin-antitoxin system PemK/MazF family toxin [Shewanella sp. A32]